ncbi:MAG: bile acid:sodium symporter [Desulfobacca sp.]|nr:bile acid:sodium symporter [Desulfobacca sp.]
MFRGKDAILLVVIYASLLVGIFFPGFSSLFQPVPFYSMMTLLFLSFLPLRLADIWKTLAESLGVISIFLIIRMILLPVSIALLFKILWPEYALSALLLSGISTGVVAPFISNLLGANTSLVLVMVVISSLLVPFTLPALVDILFGRALEISQLGMMRLLAMVIFIPVLLTEVVRRVSGGLTQVLMKNQYYISLVLFAMTNLGIFSKYSDFFYQKPGTLVVAILVAIILGGLYLFSGLILAWGRPLQDQLAAVISLGIMNNILVIVFSSQFFTPLEPTVAAMYMIPFFGLILPLRAYGNWKVK